MYNSLNTYSSSPQMPMSKYECSPIMSVDKYQIIKRNIVGDGLGSGTRNPCNLVDFHNQNTPIFKEPACQERKEPMRDKLFNNPYINLIKVPLNTTNSLIGNYIMTLNNQAKMDNNTGGYLPIPGIISSLKKVDTPNGVTNIYINYANTKNKSEFLKKKSSRPKSKTKKEDPKKEFKLDEVIVNGKKIDCLLPIKGEEAKSSHVKIECDLSDSSLPEHLVDPTSAFNTINIVKPLYENEFRRLTNYKNRLKTIEGKNNPSPKTAKNMNSYIKDPKFTTIFKDNMTSYAQDYNLRYLDNPKKIYLDSLKEYKTILLTLQDDYVNKTRKLVCWQLIDKAQNIIERINELTRILIVSGREYLKIAEVKEKEPKESRAGAKTYKRKKINYYYQNYDCEICKRSFDTGQGLGGHMSRMHPNCSTKYREKIIVRRSRVHMRKILYMAKERLLSKYGYDYEKLLGNPSSKKVVKKIISEHKSEFRNLLKEMKK